MSAVIGVAGGPVEFEPNRYCWPELDREGSARLWSELVGWVSWLRERYELTHAALPKCWYRHGWIVEELTALMAAWQQAYHYTEDDQLGDDGNVAAQFNSAMAYWHRTFLWPMLHEIGSQAIEHDETRCRRESPEPYPDDMQDWIGAMIESRPRRAEARARVKAPTAAAALSEVGDDEDTDVDEAPRSRFLDPADITEAIDDGDAKVLTGEGHPAFPDVLFEGLRWTYDADREDYRSVVEDEPPER